MLYCESVIHHLNDRLPRLLILCFLLVFSVEGTKRKRPWSVGRLSSWPSGRILRRIYCTYCVICSLSTRKRRACCLQEKSNFLIHSPGKEDRSLSTDTTTPPTLMEVTSSCPCSVGASHGVRQFQVTNRNVRMARTGKGRNQPNSGRRLWRVVDTRGSGSGDRSGTDQLSGKEFFESFLRRRQADGDFVSKATDVLWKKELIELDEESRQKVRDKLSQLQQLKEGDYNGSFLKLSQSRNWSSGQDAAPANPTAAALERERAREDRKKQSQLEYEALKRELSLMTAGVAVAVSAYCFILLSPEATLSYGIGALASLAYLQLLYRHVDDVSEENVPQIFVHRRRKRIGITTSDLQESFERTIRGTSRALSSPRLVLPPALYGLWGLTDHFAENSPIHLEIAPLLFGFFAYKGAALVQAYRDNKDLLFMLPDSQDSQDS